MHKKYIWDVKCFHCVSINFHLRVKKALLFSLEMKSVGLLFLISSAFYDLEPLVSKYRTL